LHAGTAQPVDGLARDLDRKSREQQRHSRHVAVVLTRLVGAAEDDVLHLARFHVRPVAGLLEDDRGEVIRPQVLQLPTVPPHRRAGRGNYDRLGPPHLRGGGAKRRRGCHFLDLRARKACTPSANSSLEACASWRYDSNSRACSKLDSSARLTARLAPAIAWRGCAARRSASSRPSSSSRSAGTMRLVTPSRLAPAASGAF